MIIHTVNQVNRIIYYKVIVRLVKQSQQIYFMFEHNLVIIILRSNLVLNYISTILKHI